MNSGAHSAWQLVRERMTRLGIREADLEERFILGSGSGGQKVNRTASTVQLLHRPSGVEVKVGEERSQHMSRLRARQRLCAQIERTKRERRLEKAADRARKRFQNRRPSKGATARRVDSKRKRSAVKSMRKKPSQGD